LLTRKQLETIQLMIEQEMTQREIAERLNISEVTISRWKKDEEFKRIFEKTLRDSINLSSSYAYRTMVKLLGARSELVRFQAAKDILDRAGFKPTEKSEINHNHTGNLDHHVNLSSLSDEELEKALKKYDDN